MAGYNCQSGYHFRMSSGSTPAYQSVGDATVDARIWADPVPSQLGWTELDPTDADAGRGHLDLEYAGSLSGSTTGQVQVYCDVNS